MEYRYTDNMGSQRTRSPSQEEERSHYQMPAFRHLEFGQMLNNIAHDLDNLLQDLCQIYPYHGPGHPRKPIKQLG
ncbi:hypothetical protein ScPMuIL_014226 [Solemya velum]